jgi:phosphatidylglycerophosphate synthase
VGTATGALVAVVCFAWMAHVELALSAWYPIKAAILSSIVLVLALGRLRGHHPFPRFGPGNQLTTVRAVLVVLVTSLIGETGRPLIVTIAIAVALSAAVLDGVDGWLARRAGMASAFGARFDVEIDALLIQALAILAWRYGKAGPWVLLSGAIRYGFIIAGRLWLWLRQPLAPTQRGRAICVVQIAALLLAIVPAIRPPLSAAIAALGLVALGYSFLVDTLRLWRQA